MESRHDLFVLMTGKDFIAVKGLIKIEHTE